MAAKINAIRNFLKKIMICASQGTMHAVKFTHSAVINPNSKQPSFSLSQRILQ